MKQLKPAASKSIRPCHLIWGRSLCTFTAAVCSLTSPGVQNTKSCMSIFSCYLLQSHSFLQLWRSPSVQLMKNLAIYQGAWLFPVLYFVLSLAPKHVQRDNFRGALRQKLHCCPICLYISHSRNIRMFLRSHKHAKKENALFPSLGVKHCVLNYEGSWEKNCRPGC